MDTTIEKLQAYNAIGLTEQSGWQSVAHGLNARGSVYIFQNVATPIGAGVSSSVIITTGDYPWLLNSLELGQIGPSGDVYPASRSITFNMLDSDNEPLFGGLQPPRLSSIFGNPQQVAYAVQPVKVFMPKTKMKLLYSNVGSVPQGFEMLFRGIEVKPDGYDPKNEPSFEDKLRELINDYEPRTL